MGRELAIILAREVNQFAMFDGLPALFWARPPGADTRPLDSMIHCRSDLQYPHDHRHGTPRDQMEMSCFVSATKNDSNAAERILFPTQAGE